VDEHEYIPNDDKATSGLAPNGDDGNLWIVSLSWERHNLALNMQSSGT
jgi:hypothetical protein